MSGLMRVDLEMMFMDTLAVLRKSLCFKESAVSIKCHISSTGVR